jgi:hypothetical protein
LRVEAEAICVVDDGRLPADAGKFLIEYVRAETPVDSLGERRRASPRFERVNQPPVTPDRIAAVGTREFVRAERICTNF